MEEKKPAICDSKWCGRKADFKVHLRCFIDKEHKEYREMTQNFCKWHAKHSETGTYFDGAVQITKTPIEEDA